MLTALADSRRSVSIHLLNATLNPMGERVSILKFSHILTSPSPHNGLFDHSSALWRPILLLMVVSGLVCTDLSAKERPSLPLIYPLSAPPSLSSSFGTYRINHHHAGLDLYGKEGTPVLAAADGHISLIKRGSSGYGRAIYLKHKGGFTTLYGHMSAFAPEVDALIARARKKQRSFKLKLRPREQFKVKAGQVIGYLGTSGTDLMHLHFELRYKNTPINPLTHGLSLPDTQAPTLITLFATPFGEGARVDGQAGPKAFSLGPRPKRLPQPAIAIFPPERSASQPPNEAPSTPTSPAEQADPEALRLEVWGDVRLSLEVEDRVDGSARELTPYEVILELDGKPVHHLRYDESTYTHPRSSELDFDLALRGPDKRLVHRLYQYQARFRTLKRSTRSPLKRLKAGEHKGKVIAIDASGNKAERAFSLLVKRPEKPSCGVKKARLASVKMRRPRGASMIDPALLSWRPYGFSAPLSALGVEGFECVTGRELFVDVRWNGERAPKRTVQLTQLDGAPALSFDLRTLKLGAETRDPTQERAKKKKVAQAGSTQGEEKPIDHSAQLWVGVRQAEEKAQWWTLTLHEVRSEVSFKASRGRRSVKVEVAKDAPFMPYLTAMKVTPFSDEAREALKRRGFEPLSPLMSWAQGWLPMRRGNLITLPKRRKNAKRSGGYLQDYGRWWWVTSSWGDGEVSVSSTHISSFAALKDLAPPQIGEPCWSLEPPIGPRLTVPLSDLGAGLGKVKATLDKEELPFELQSAWGRLLYRPQGAVTPGSHSLWVAVKDKAGHRVERQFTLTWPPSADAQCQGLDHSQLTPPELD